MEHPVTEETTGIDLVIEQFRIADGLPLLVTETPAPRGHSIEFRINAEDPGRGFLPTPGTITTFEAPSGPGVRLDSGVVSGSTIPGTFDSLMAKLIVTGATREQALTRARRALKEFRIEGVATVLPFHRAAMEAADFIGDDGFKVHTRWIETDFADRLAADARPDPGADTSSHPHPCRDRRQAPCAWYSRSTSGRSRRPERTDRRCRKHGDARRLFHRDGAHFRDAASLEMHRWRYVKEGDLLAVMEAMKMETQILSARSGETGNQGSGRRLCECGAALGRIE